jgi:hypothetical protein
MGADEARGTGDEDGKLGGHTRCPTVNLCPGNTIELETIVLASMLGLLANEQPNPEKGYEPREVLADVLRIRGAESESSGLAREIRADREAESLLAWADENGVLMREDQPPPEDELTGGEHLVELDEDSGQVFKATKPGKFGFSVDRQLIRPKGRKTMPRITIGLADGTPDEYLARLQWQNSEFGDEIRILAIAVYPRGASVLSSQPFYRGERTAQKTINEWFAQRSWKLVSNMPGAFFHAEKDLLVLDALPRNVLTLTTGSLMPFDVVIVRPSAEVKSSLIH